MLVKRMLFILLLCYHVKPAVSSLFIDPEHYQVDHHHHLIVINQAVEHLVGSYQPHTTVSLDDQYHLQLPTSQFQVGQAYAVTNQDNGETYQLYFTELPLVHVEPVTTIVDEPVFPAQLSFSTSEGSFLKSWVGIEYRGGSSQSLDKKSFKIEFWQDQTGAHTKDVQLLDMRVDDDWNLQAMYNEPLRLRNKSCHQLWKEMSRLYYQQQEPDAVNGIAMQYVELFVEGEYRGVYGLGERIDRQQLQLQEKDAASNRGQLYKGIYWDDVPTFQDVSDDYNNIYHTWRGFEQTYPDDSYDWATLHQFCDFVVNSSDSLFYTDFTKYFDIDNAVDYFIFLNLVRAADNTGKNVFLAQYDQGEPFYYAAWDLDGSLGSEWNGHFHGWYLGLLSNGLYDRLLHDCQPNGFKNLLKKRWRELCQSVLSQEHILAILTKNHQYLKRNGVYAREKIAWPDYCMEEEDFTQLQYWCINRLRELDFRFKETCIPVIDFDPKDVYSFQQMINVYPTPASDYLYIDYKDKREATARLYHINGTFLQEFTITQGHQIHDISLLEKGIYLLYVQQEDLQFTQRIVVD